MRRHRDLMGAISLDVLLAQRMMRIFPMYFSMVRRRAAWASRLSESASLIMTTTDKMRDDEMIERVDSYSNEAIRNKLAYP